MKACLSFRAVVTAAGALVLALPGTVLAQEDQSVTDETLLDRIRIEDLMVRYYADLGEASGEEMASHFTEDGVLDVNNMVYRGRDEIEGIYDSTGEDTGEDYEGAVNTLVTNAIVNVNGDEANIWLIWTDVLNESIEEPPQFLEQGRDYTELVKRDGRWLIEHRYVTTDGGAPEYWRQNYVERSFR